jgi:hypothetical protein
MIKEEEISLLTRLVGALKETFLRLERAYGERDFENFEKEKKKIIQIQKKISETLK